MIECRVALPGPDRTIRNNSPCIICGTPTIRYEYYLVTSYEGGNIISQGGKVCSEECVNTWILQNI